MIDTTTPRLSSATLALLTDLLTRLQQRDAALDALLGDDDHPVAVEVRKLAGYAAADLRRAAELASDPVGRPYARRLRQSARTYYSQAAALLQQAGAYEDGA